MKRTGKAGSSSQGEPGCALLRPVRRKVGEETGFWYFRRHAAQLRRNQGRRSRHGIAYLHCGGASFLLQDFYVQGHADNFQMHLLVGDVDAWHGKAIEVAQHFHVKIGEPEDQPWAMRDFVLFDPSGVLWRIAQNIPRRSGG